MLSLSNHYAAAATGAEKETLLPVGQAVLAMGSNPAGFHPSTGMLMSILLVACAGLLTSLVMLRSGVFGKPTAQIGFLASAFDIAYCLTFAFVPTADVIFLPAAGFSWWCGTSWLDGSFCASASGKTRWNHPM